jgi:hypothetical protein
MFMPTLVDDLLDVVRRPYDSVDHVVVDGVHETMLDPVITPSLPWG